MSRECVENARAVRSQFKETPEKARRNY